MIFDVYLTEFFFLVLVLSGIPLILSSAAGLVAAVFQAATQIQEQSITYLVKFGAIAGTCVLLGPWAADQVLAFLQDMLKSLPALGRVWGG